MGYRGRKRYIRLVITFVGTHTVGTPIRGVVVLDPAAVRADDVRLAGIALGGHPVPGQPAPVP